MFSFVGLYNCFSAFILALLVANWPFCIKFKFDFSYVMRSELNALRFH